MLYKVTPAETWRARTPHNLFNLNILIVHLFASYTIFELGGVMFLLLIPVVSALILFYIRHQSLAKRQTDTWFVAAHWTLAWRRSRILLMSYAIAIAMVVVYFAIDMLFPGGMSMNSLSIDEDAKQNIGEIIVERFAATVIFFAVIYTFILTAGSTFNAGRGEIDVNIVKYCPRDENANEEEAHRELYK